MVLKRGTKIDIAIGALLIGIGTIAVAGPDQVCVDAGGGLNLGPDLGASWVGSWALQLSDSDGAQNPQDFFWPSTATDAGWSVGSSCPGTSMTTTHEKGPIPGSDKYFDYETNYFRVVAYHGHLSDGRCRASPLLIWNRGLSGPDSGGEYGTGGIICATRFNGPQLSVAPLTVVAKKTGTVKVRLFRGQQGVGGGSLLKTSLAFNAEGGRAWCPEVTDSEGYASCRYEAPPKPTVDRLTAKWFYAADTTPRATAEGTITVIPPTVVVGLFNGVWNTSEQAQDGLEATRKLIGDTHGATKLRYEKFYNQTGSVNGATGAQDIAEVFIQRSKELDGVLANRWEHYWELLSGRLHQEGSLTQRLLAGLRDGAASLSDLFDSLVSSMLASFVKGLSALLSSPPTQADMAAQLAKLQSLADEGRDFVLIAHSQGNLFVNVAYDGLRQTRPEAKAGVVHVAPASPTVRGKHVLADIDEVINGLRNFGSWTVQPINLWVNGRGSDPSGHTYIGTYLDASRVARTNPGAATTTPRAHTMGLITDALEQTAPISP